MAKRLPVYIQPHPGQQTRAATCPADEIFYGGTRGGGKSYIAIGRQLRGATKYGKDWRGLMARKKYKNLGQLKRVFDDLKLKGAPLERIGGENQSNHIRFLGGPAKGAEIILTAFQHVTQLEDWQGFEFGEVTIDEAPQISYVAAVVNKMRGTLRSGNKNIHPTLFLTGNPGGPGAGFLKMTFVKAGPWGKIMRVPVRWIDINGDEIDEEVTRVYIHSVLDDNPSLDPREYRKKLAMISDGALLQAWMYGDWDVTVGQAFSFTDRHVIDPIWPIPEHAPIYMTFDWGFGAPFSIGWWWVDSDGRIYRFAEWYGWDGKNPNVGLRLTDYDIAKGILERERVLQIDRRQIDRIAGPDSFRKKPNYMGGGQGPSTADEFRSAAEALKVEFGEHINPNLRPGDADRAKKLRQFRNRLRLSVDPKEMPMLVVYRSCEQFCRTIPDIALDEDNIEVIEDGQEDHCYDEACHICMTLPILADMTTFAHDARVAEVANRVGKLDNASREAAREFLIARRQIAAQMGLDETDVMMDPTMDPTAYGLDEEFFDEDALRGPGLTEEMIIQLTPGLRELMGK
ncbi:MAG: hypothetical protein ABIH23_05110 [bacterium]